MNLTPPLLIVTGILSGFAFPASASAEKRSLTFAKEIAPIIFQNCSPCHRPGEVAPFSLLSYQDVQKRAKQIAVITQKRVMPPWKPEQGHGAFLNERRLTETQIGSLQQWAAQGAPEGNPAEMPPAPKFTDGWQAGPPDLIIRMPKAYTIPAEGRDVYRSFVMRLNLPADRYVRGAEFRPGNRRVVHHATVFFDKTGKARELEQKNGGPGAGYASFGGPGFIPSGALSGYVPGETLHFASPDAPSILPKEVDLVFGMHYHPTGKVETDQSSIGIYFAKNTPRKTRIPTVILMGVMNIEIQPGEHSHLERTTYTLPIDLEVRGVGPHMHLIGKSCRLTAELPDGTRIPLIWIKDWDFNWQGTYMFQRPFRLPKGTKIHGEWTHDNTTSNPANPNSPPKVIRNGENSTDEMAGAWIDVVVDNGLDAGILWLATIGHVTDAFLRPSVKQNQTTRSSR